MHAGRPGEEEDLSTSFSEMPATGKKEPERGSRAKGLVGGSRAHSVREERDVLSLVLEDLGGGEYGRVPEFSSESRLLGDLVVAAAASREQLGGFSRRGSATSEEDRTSGSDGGEFLFEQSSPAPAACSARS